MLCISLLLLSPLFLLQPRDVVLGSSSGELTLTEAYPHYPIPEIMLSVY